MSIVDFIYNSYSGRFSYAGIKGLVSLCQHRIIVVREESGINGVAIYFKLSDETIGDVEKMRMSILDPMNFDKFMRENGENIHFFLLAADGLRTIRKGLQFVINKENPNTVSWFSPNMEQFFMRRVLCHQSL